MPITISYYEQFWGNVGGGNINLTGDVIKAALVNGYIFNAAHDEWVDITNEIVNANGYEAGGKEISNNVFGWNTEFSKTIFDGDDITWTAAGGDIGPCTGAVFYSETSGKLMAYVDFGQSEIATDTSDFKITMNTNGLFGVS